MAAGPLLNLQGSKASKNLEDRHDFHASSGAPQAHERLFWFGPDRGAQQSSFRGVEYLAVQDSHYRLQIAHIYAAHLVQVGRFQTTLSANFPASSEPGFFQQRLPRW
jgi:hypothetical protein